MEATTAKNPPAAARPLSPQVASLRGFPATGGLLDLDVRQGEVVLLQGRNGCGKTSLLRAFAGLSSPLQPASVELAGHDPRSLPARRLAATVGMALQDPRESLVGLTVRSEFRLRGLALPQELDAWADRDVATLSSGEARHVSLAAAASRAVPLLLLDEPTEGLDVRARDRLLRLVDAARRAGGAVVAADHDGLLARVATRIARLDGGDATPPGPAIPGDRAWEPLPDPGSEPLLKAPCCTVRLGAHELALPAVAFPAGMHVLAGANGSGKSTLLARLAGLRHSNGVQLRGARPEPGRDTRLLLPHAADLFTAATVSDELGGTAWTAGFVPDALLPRHPLTLSAGEAERVALAKTLGAPAQVYLLDEPEAHLDAGGRLHLLGLLRQRLAEGAVVVVATHDAVLHRLAHSVVALHAGSDAALDAPLDAPASGRGEAP